MPTGAVLLVRTRHPLSEFQLCRLRELFLAENHLGEEDFYVGGPLIAVRHPDEGPMPVRDEGSLWLNANLYRAYFGPGYERGDVELLTRCAAWLESNIPEGEVWYGHDVDDENLRPFGPAERRALLSLKQGHGT
jgi:hypothetical protein